MTAEQPTAVEFKILRQANPDARPYWERFLIPEEPMMNVISALMTIQRQPVNADGHTVDPVLWDSQCLEEVCGACSMIVNGRPRQACTTIIADLRRPVELRPMSKFPVVRDLVIDRSRMFSALREIKAWNQVDGYHNIGPGARISQDQQDRDYAVGRCMTCGVCWEVCPQVNDRSGFFGPSTLAQAVMHNEHPVGRNDRKARLRVLSGPHGVNNCGNAQNCERYCPKNVPLLSRIAEAGRQVSVHGFQQLFGKG